MVHEHFQVAGLACVLAAEPVDGVGDHEAANERQTVAVPREKSVVELGHPGVAGVRTGHATF